jgi:redox-sensitive bicupin YhaK (pirin superfamily)
MSVIESVVFPVEHDLGGFTVRRTLPSAQRKAVGPFVFFDHMGPANFAPGQGIDVRPHPHIGLATVTYLFEGSFLHRDSLGTIQPVHAGDVNWMTAGRGIVHSERTPPDLRASGSRLHGIQTWVALPQTHEETRPNFSHFPRPQLPQIEQNGARLTVIAGTAFGKASPVPVYSGTLYVAVDMQPGADITLPPEHPERSVYLVEGELELDGAPLPAMQLVILRPGTTVTLHARTAVRAMLVGGETLDGHRTVWWNFVASDRARLEAAKQAWMEQNTQVFPPVPEETERIPLPEEAVPAETKPAQVTSYP